MIRSTKTLLIPLHLTLITLLILRRQLLILLQLPIRERLVLPGDNLGNISKLGLWIVLLHSGANVIGVEEEGAHISLGGIGVLFPLFLWAVFFNVARWAVVFHLPCVTFLVFEGFLVPYCPFGWGDLFELFREELRLK